MAEAKVLAALGDVEQHGEAVFARLHGALEVKIAPTPHPYPTHSLNASEDEYTREMLKRDEANMKALLATLDKALQEQMLHTLCRSEGGKGATAMMAEFEARAAAAQSTVERVRQNSNAVRVTKPVVSEDK